MISSLHPSASNPSFHSICDVYHPAQQTSEIMYLHQLAEELQSLIVDHVSNVDTLKSLRLTNYTFGHLKRLNARLFECIKLQPLKSQLRSHRETLERVKHLVKHVKFCPLVIFEDRESEEGFDWIRRYAEGESSWQDFADLLKFLPNIQTVATGQPKVTEGGWSSIPSGPGLIQAMAWSLGASRIAPSTLEIAHLEAPKEKGGESEIAFFWQNSMNWERINFTQLKRLEYKPIDLRTPRRERRSLSDPMMGLTDIATSCASTLEELYVDCPPMLFASSSDESFMEHRFPSLRKLELVDMEFKYMAENPNFVSWMCIKCPALTELILRRVWLWGKRESLDSWEPLFQVVRGYKPLMKLEFDDVLAETKCGARLSFCWDPSQEVGTDDKETEVVKGLKKYLAKQGDWESEAWGQWEGDESREEESESEESEDDEPEDEGSHESG